MGVGVGMGEGCGCGCGCGCGVRARMSNMGGRGLNVTLAAWFACRSCAPAASSSSPSSSSSSSSPSPPPSSASTSSPPPPLPAPSTTTRRHLSDCEPASTANTTRNNTPTCAVAPNPTSFTACSRRCKKPTFGGGRRKRRSEIVSYFATAPAVGTHRVHMCTYTCSRVPAPPLAHLPLPREVLNVRALHLRRRPVHGGVPRGAAGRHRQRRVRRPPRPRPWYWHGSGGSGLGEVEQAPVRRHPPEHQMDEVGALPRQEPREERQDGRAPGQVLLPGGFGPPCLGHEAPVQQTHQDGHGVGAVRWRDAP